MLIKHKWNPSCKWKQSVFSKSGISKAREGRQNQAAAARLPAQAPPPGRPLGKGAALPESKPVPGSSCSWVTMKKTQGDLVLRGRENPNI